MRDVPRFLRYGGKCGYPADMAFDTGNAGVMAKLVGVGFFGVDAMARICTECVFVGVLPAGDTCSSENNGTGDEYNDANCKCANCW